MDINKTRALREQGYTYREIERETGVPRSTAQRIIKSSPHWDGSGVQTTSNGNADYRRSLLVHLPFYYFCPDCGKEQRHAWLCLECGRFLTAECDDNCCYVEGFDLSDVTRRPEIIEYDD